MGWSYDFWVGTLYPKGLQPDEFLREYSRHFATVEVDNTFYRIPRPEVVDKWRDATPADFLFSCKFPQVITHEKMLRDCEEETKVFTERISRLGERLGVLLLQFPYNFEPKHLPSLKSFLASLPKGYRYAVEVRNRELLSEELYALLRDSGVALALVEHPFMPRAEEVTAEFAYIRWEGDRRKVKGTLGKVEVDRRDKIGMWAEKINRLLGEEIEVFGYFSKYFSGYPPSDIEQLSEMLRSNG